LPCNQSSEKDFRERGTDSKSKASFKIAQIILARTQSNKMWSIDSKTPHTQHLSFPFQPLRIRDWPTGSLLLKVCQRKKIYFKLDFTLPDEASHLARHSSISQEPIQRFGSKSLSLLKCPDHFIIYKFT
jgi:hypothetical protein